jgi:subtilisin family serine protease
LQIEYNNSPGLVGIGAQTAYDAGYTGLGVKVAVIDSGATASHPELIANLSREHIMEKGTILTHTGDIWTSYYGVKGWVPEEINFTGDQVIKVSYSMTDSDQVYTSAPAITITGDGTGATAEALLDVNGKIKAVVITNPGSGYTHVSASIDDATGNIAISDIRLAGVDEAGAYSNGHGTFVLSQVGASAGDGGIRGVANNATLFSIKAGNGDGVNMDQVLHGVAWAQTQGVNVINQSFGGYNTQANYDNINNYVLAQQANISFVTAAGNEAKSCADITQCTRPAALPWESGMASADMLNQKGAWIVVGALNSTLDDLAYFSNKAGITKSNYILAPGMDMKGADMYGNIVTGQGTSFAAPIVSGAMALMYEKWPALTGREMGNILFATADDMGEAGVDDIYGNGKMNLNKAFAPVGATSIPTASASKTTTKATIASTTSAPLTNTRMVTSSSMSMSPQSFEALDNTIVLDSYQRDFKVNMSSAVTTTTNSSINFDDFASTYIGDLIVGVNTLTNDGVVGWQFDKTLSLVGTYTNDLFGTSSSGALGIDNAQTYYLNAKKIVDMDDIRLEGQVTYGYGKANATTGSLVSDISSVQGLGGKAKASYSGYGVSYEIPMRVISGEMDFSIPTSRTTDGYVNYQNISTKLSPNALEQRVGLFHEMTKERGLFRTLVEIEHTTDKFNVAGLTSNDVRLSMYWYY